MELKDLVALYRRWVWLLVAGLALGLVAGYVVSRYQTPVYEATAKVLVSRGRQQGSTDILALSDQQLVLTYQELLKTRSVLDEAGARVGAKIDPDNVKVEIITTTQIIQVKVQDTNINQAVNIANILIRILIEQNETLQAGRYAAYEDGLNAQIAQVQKQIEDLQDQITQIDQANITEQLNMVNRQITDLQDEISSLEKEISNFSGYLNTANRASLAGKQSELDQLRSILQLYQQIRTNLTFIGQPVQSGAGRDDPRLTSLEETLKLYRSLYLNLLNNLETAKLSRAQSTPTVTEIEKAIPPEKPIRPIPLLYIPLSGMVGLLIAAGGVLLFDYFDDTLKSSQKIQEVLGLPVIGEISQSGRVQGRNNGNGKTSMVDPSFLNAFGSLRINVSRLTSQQSLKTVLITSPALGDGKTTVASNLALAFARFGKKVILLDTDMYHPQLHARFGFENETGLINILESGMDWKKVSHEYGGMNIITSGKPSMSSPLLLESDAMTRLLEKLHKEADVVILDGPPVFIEDSQILASKVGGILLVVRQGSTITGLARSMLNQLNLMDVNVLGIVLNGVPRAETYYFDGYYRNHHGKRKERTEEDGSNRI